MAKRDSLIADISDDYSDLRKTRRQTKIQHETLESIDDDPDLKQRLVSALKAGFEEALEQLVEAPLAKITVKNFKGHIETS
ncbi:MAG: hypothetical protein AAGB19_12000 [Cyanobacteria bacterium P01_F01_bin.3]